MKICPVCNTSKTESEFSKNKSKKDGLQYRCKSCAKIVRKEYITPESKIASALYQKEYYTDPIHKQRRAESQKRRSATPEGIEINYAKYQKYYQSPKGKMNHRKVYLKYSYQLTPEQYDVILKEQGGLCAICKTDKAGGQGGDSFHVDHDHSCCPGKKSCGKCTRGLLCHKCNTGGGLFNDSPEMLHQAAIYFTPKLIGNLDSNSLFIINPKYIDDLTSGPIVHQGTGS